MSRNQEEESVLFYSTPLHEWKGSAAEGNRSRDICGARQVLEGGFGCYKEMVE